MEREQFTFYRSFWEALKALPKKDQLPFVMAVCAYAFGEDFKPLTGASAASFLLVKPILDKASKRAASGKQGGSKPKANGKQTQAKPKQSARDIEGEKEGEREKEKEGEGDTPLSPHDPAAAVLRAYMDRINPAPSQGSLDELRGYAEVLGEACCLRAFDIALDAKKASWPYIRAILRDKQAQGVRCLADWNALDEKRAAAKSGGARGAKSWVELVEKMGGSV